MGDTSNQGKKSKRQDLQGIRGLAIIAVLGFHYYPDFLPNGYLGVDQFFVLSGFLMCMLLKRSENLPTFSLITLFYSKRFKRILPLYLLIIALSMIFLYSLFPDTSIENNRFSASNALLFVSNRPKTDQENYFQMLAIGIDIFTHTWSLSVEVQFYFLVPVIFILGARFSPNLQYLYYTTIGMLVFLLNSNNKKLDQRGEKIELLLRLEEFEKEDYDVFRDAIEKQGRIDDYEKNVSNVKIHFIFLKYTCLIFLIWIVSYPIELHGSARLAVTFLTGFLIFCSENDKILSNIVLTYIGDISYSLYLIHWPIHAYWKLTMNNNQAELFALLLVSVILAVIIYETFECWYLKLSSNSIGALVVFLFILNVLLINKDYIIETFDTTDANFIHSSLDGVTENMTIDDAIRLNRKWTIDDTKPHKTPTCIPIGGLENKRWCEHTGLSKTAPYRIAIFGNSWCSNHGTMFYQECHKKANRIIQGAARGCEVFYPSDDSKMCNFHVKNFEKHVSDFKPDYGFVFTRYFTIGDPLTKNATSLDDDKIYQFMKNQVKQLTSKINKKLYILGPIPRVSATHLATLATDIKSGVPLEKIDKKLVVFTNYEMAMKRHAQLYKDCGPKCVAIDYTDSFFNNESSTFRFYDEKGFSYYTGSNHLSPHGLEHIRSIYTNICNHL